MTFANRHILAVDDTEAIRTFLRILLESQGANVHEAATAQEALQVCREVDPDLIVLDLGLPDRDGLEILPELKMPKSGKTPKVLILSVRKEQTMKEKARQLGADAYLSKPFMVEDLLEVIGSELAH